jgi:hypothetical protein
MDQSIIHGSQSGLKLTNAKESIADHWRRIEQTGSQLVRAPHPDQGVPARVGGTEWVPCKCPTPGRVTTGEPRSKCNESVIDASNRINATRWYLGWNNCVTHIHQSFWVDRCLFDSMAKAHLDSVCKAFGFECLVRFTVQMFADYKFSDCTSIVNVAQLRNRCKSNCAIL